MRHGTTLAWITILLICGVGCGGGTPADGGLPDGAPASPTDAAPTDGSVDPPPLPGSDARFCEAAGWCFLNPVPHGNDLHGVHGAEGAVFVVGAGGIVLRRDEAGWTYEHLPDGVQLTDVWALSPDLAYVVGPLLSAVPPRAVVYRWDGSAFREVHGLELPVGGGYSAAQTPAVVYARSATEVYVAFGDRIDRFDGSGWSQSTTPEDSIAVADLWGTADGNVFAVGHDNGHLAFASEGFVWRLDGDAWSDLGVTVGPLTAIDGVSGDDAVASGPGGDHVAYDGATWTVTDAAGSVSDYARGGGSEWVVASTDELFWSVLRRGEGEGAWEDTDLPAQLTYSLGPARRLPTLYAVSSDEVFLAAPSGVLGHYHGGRWDVSEPDAAFLENLVDVWAVSADEAYVVSRNERVFEWDGEQWSDGAVEGRAVWGDDAGAVFLAGRDGVWRHEPGGSWTLLPDSPGELQLLAGAGGTLFGADASQRVHRFDGDGWTVADLPSNAIALWARGAADAFLVREAGGADPLVWRWDGATWAGIDGAPTDLDRGAIMSGNADELLIIGARLPGAVVYRYDGSAWTEEPTVVSALTDVVADAEGTYLLTDGSGRVFRLDGSTWTAEPQINQWPLDALTVDADGRVWAVGQLGRVLIREPG